MLISESFSIGLKELLANKIRSFLSMLGIVIGVISLVIMMSIMNGIEQTWLTHINALGGLKKATVKSIVPEVEGLKREDLQKELTLEDARLVKQNGYVHYASAQGSNYLSVGQGGLSKSYVQVVGGMRDVLQVNGQKLDKGRPITDEDNESKRNVCVIGTTIRDDLFGPNVNPIGKMITIQDQFFEVVGLLDKNELMRRKRNILNHRNQIIYIPVTVMIHKLKGELKITEILYLVGDQKNIHRAQREVQAVLDKSHRHVGDIEVKTEEEKYLESKKSLTRMKIGFSIIAGISLIVGGIGIMNIMIASVVQRIREVGVRKAVGAKSRDIFFQFLIESALVSGVGGLVGIGGSFLVVSIMEKVATTLNPVMSFEAMVLSSIFSILVGICFGLYPAIKASKLDPITALRYQ